MIWNKAKRQESQQQAQPAQKLDMAGQVGATAQALDLAAAAIPFRWVKRRQLPKLRPNINPQVMLGLRKRLTQQGCNEVRTQRDQRPSLLAAAGLLSIKECYLIVRRQPLTC